MSCCQSCKMVFKWFLAFSKCNEWGYEINFRQFHENRQFHLVIFLVWGGGIEWCVCVCVLLFSSVSDLLSSMCIPMKNTSDWTICQSLTWVFRTHNQQYFTYFYLSACMWYGYGCGCMYMFCVSLFVWFYMMVFRIAVTQRIKHQSDGWFVVALIFYLTCEWMKP